MIENDQQFEGGEDEAEEHQTDRDYATTERGLNTERKLIRDSLIGSKESARESMVLYSRDSSSFLINGQNDKWSKLEHDAKIRVLLER